MVMLVFELDVFPRLVDLREYRCRVVQRDDSTDLGDDLEVLRCSTRMTSAGTMHR